jgi:putative ATP-binding cassette transporter
MLPKRRLASILKDAWRLTFPYFKSEEKWPAFVFLGLIIGCSMLAVRMTVILNYWNRALMNSIQDRSMDTFLSLLLWGKTLPEGSVPPLVPYVPFPGDFMPGILPLVAFFIGLYVPRVYLTQWLQIRWRRWLTQVYIDKWLNHGAYYRISLTSHDGKEDTDNPDQRISEDVRDFVDHTLTLGRELLVNVASLFSFLYVLWQVSGTLDIGGLSIPGYLVWAAVAYAVLGSWLTHLLGVRLVGINFRQQKVEANFRYAAVRVRENTEGIALYAGEKQERANLSTRFADVMANWFSFIKRTAIMNAFQYVYIEIGSVFPLVILGVRYIKTATMTMGDIFQGLGAFAQVMNALNWFVNSYNGNSPSDVSLTRWRSIVERLASFDAAIAESHAQAGPVVDPRPDATGFTTHDLTLTLPDGTALVENAQLALVPGQSVVVTGRSGSGKSTLFRAMAGIWPYGSGRIERPPEADVLFLPQRPYSPLGTLRASICYPELPAHFTDEAITGALHDVDLGHLVAELDDDEPWAARLSGGELQRLAIARALLARPAWLFLDEATSNLDRETEAALYRTMHERLPNTTIVSITHREDVAALHQRRLVLRRGRGEAGHLDEPAEADA